MLDVSAETSRRSHTLLAIQAAIAAGFAACLAYGLAALGRLPISAVAVLAAVFGPALAVACFGLRQLLDLEKPLASSAFGLLLAAPAGALFTAMGLVQLATAATLGGQKPSAEMHAIWLGLDLAWDAYICLGTCFFALAMFHHPRFGKTFSISGFVVAGSLLALHIITFPSPPQNAGLVDLGPALGLWYFFVTIQMWRSFPWAKQRLLQTARLSVC